MIFDARISTYIHFHQLSTSLLYFALFHVLKQSEHSNRTEINSTAIDNTFNIHFCL